MSMGVHYGLYQEQSQKLMMTQQMQQALTVLQCSAIELDGYIQDELGNNPLADVQPLSAEWQLPVGVFLGGSRAAFGYAARGERVAPPLEQVVQARATLADFLAEQVRLASCNVMHTEVATLLIGCLDENGYLRESTQELAAWLDMPEDVVGQAVELLQACDPAGVGARDLQECLRLQMHLVPTCERALVAHVIDHHLDDLAAGRMSHIARALHVSAARLQTAVDALRRLNPKPGASVGGDRPIYIIPDVVVERVEGRYVTIANDAAEPRIHLAPAYRKWLTAADEETRQYLVRKVQAVEWLTRCLEQRRMTLRRVVETIVDRQTEFLDHGPASMRPLTLRQVAAELGVHESTVSRAIRNKYVQTPRGVFEMKYFFTAELTGDAGTGAASAEAAKHAIRQLIAAEDAAHPHSDDALCALLGAQGIHISRRTVAKYREAMQIPTSARRRRFGE